MLNDMEAAAEAHAAARGRLVYMQERRKILKNMLMAVAEATGERTQTRQERYAYTNPQYTTHIEQLRAAVEDEAYKAGKVKLCEARWESWRSLNASVRAAARG